MMLSKLAGDPTVALFSLESGRSLLERIGKLLGVPTGRMEERGFEDGEHKIRPLESVRGREVYVVESLVGDARQSVNDKLVRILFFTSALRDNGARSVTIIAPYLCYSRKDARTKARDPVTTRYVALLFEAAGATRMVTVDVHNPAAYQNAFRIPTEHLTAAPAFVDALAPMLGERAAAVVSPDAGGVKRAERVRQLLEHRLERSVGFAFIEKFRSEGVVRGGAVVGDVADKVVLIIDDLISSGTTLVRAAEACLAHGASAAYAAATHGIFASSASAVLSSSALDRIVILDTIGSERIDPRFAKTRLEIIDCAPLLATAIHRLHTHGSIVALTGESAADAPSSRVAAR